MKYFIFIIWVFSFSVAASDQNYRVGINYLGISKADWIVQASEDSVFAGYRFRSGGFSIGPGFGAFRYRFDDIAPLPGEYQGYKDKTEFAFDWGYFIDYQKGNFFANLLISSPRFTASRSRVKTYVIEPGDDGINELFIERENRKDFRNRVESFFTIGVVF